MSMVAAAVVSLSNSTALLASNGDHGEQERMLLRAMLRESALFRWMTDASLDLILDKLVRRTFAQVCMLAWYI